MARLLSRSPRRVCVPNRATRAPWWGGNGSGVVDERAEIDQMAADIRYEVAGKQEKRGAKSSAVRCCLIVFRSGMFKVRLH